MPVIGGPRSEIVALKGLRILRSKNEPQVVGAILHYPEGVSDGEEEMSVVVIAVPAGLDPELDRACRPLEMPGGAIGEMVGTIDERSGP